MRHPRLAFAGWSGDRLVEHSGLTALPDGLAVNTLSALRRLHAMRSIDSRVTPAMCGELITFASCRSG
jgi:hypothetical protein